VIVSFVAVVIVLLGKLAVSFVHLSSCNLYVCMYVSLSTGDAIVLLFPIHSLVSVAFVVSFASAVATVIAGVVPLESGGLCGLPRCL
jgi:hypothetical protein